MNQRIKVVGELAEFTGTIIKKLTVEATANLIEATPKDTGWARANWIPNIGAIIVSTNGSREQAVEGNINSSAQTVGIANVVINYRISDGAVYITNNVPYIIPLNEGSSSQAPKAFVQSEIAKAIRKVSNVHSK